MRPGLIVFGDLGEKQRFAAAGGANNQLAAEFIESLDRGVNGLALIRAEREIYRFAVPARLDRAGSQHDVAALSLPPGSAAGGNSTWPFAAPGGRPQAGRKEALYGWARPAVDVIRRPAKLRSTLRAAQVCRLGVAFQGDPCSLLAPHYRPMAVARLANLGLGFRGLDIRQSVADQPAQL